MVARLDGPQTEQMLSQIVQSLANIERQLASGNVGREDLVYLNIDTPTVPLNTTLTLQMHVTGLSDHQPRPFKHLVILQVEIAAIDLISSDTVTLRLFRRGGFQVPQELVAEFAGTSQVTGTWVANFSNRRIDYFDLTLGASVWVSINNPSGNSGPTTFNVWIWAKVVS